MHCGMDFFVFYSNFYVNVLRDIHSIPNLCILVIAQIVKLCTFGSEMPSTDLLKIQIYTQTQVQANRDTIQGCTRKNTLA